MRYIRRRRNEISQIGDQSSAGLRKAKFYHQNLGHLLGNSGGYDVTIAILPAGKNKQILWKKNCENTTKPSEKSEMKHSVNLTL